LHGGVGLGTVYANKSASDNQRNSETLNRAPPERLAAFASRRWAIVLYNGTGGASYDTGALPAVSPRSGIRQPSP
jgi:hypothetical protein